MTPRAAALSIRLTASRNISTLSSAPFSAAISAFLVRVRSSARTDLLRRRRFSFWRLRLIWLAILATWGSSVLSTGVQAAALRGEWRDGRQPTGAGSNHSRSRAHFPHAEGHAGGHRHTPKKCVTAGPGGGGPSWSP